MLASPSMSSRGAPEAREPAVLGCLWRAGIPGRYPVLPCPLTAAQARDSDLLPGVHIKHPWGEVQHPKSRASFMCDGEGTLSDLVRAKGGKGMKAMTCSSNPPALLTSKQSLGLWGMLLGHPHLLTGSISASVEGFCSCRLVGPTLSLLCSSLPPSAIEGG